MNTSALCLLKVINDILDFSKIEAGKLDLEATDFTLRETLSATVKPMAMRAHEKGLELACHIPADVPDDLVGDPVRLRQILLNLIGNALKFTERGEVVVSVETATATSAQVSLHFRVRDTGIGIPADKQRQIFEAFSQADGSTTRKYGGTGLGLSISLQLVEMMGGRIWVESVPGQGSTFHFTMPFARGTAQHWPGSSAAPPRLQGMPVLVVDDNATNRRILQEMLNNWDMQPTVVDSGEAALQALQRGIEKNERFPLVLLDCMMPGMDGFTLAAEIKAHAEFGRPPMLMLGSGNQRGEVARCREVGIAVHLAKPILQAELLRAIHKALRISLEAAPAARIIRPAPEIGGKRLAILLAEDNLINQKIAVRMLEKEGHHVKVAGNGKEALTALQQESFDLVLMDVQMPEMGGFETTSIIRMQENGGGRLPIVAMTAHAMKGDRERCLAAGMDDYIAKPVQRSDLLRVLDSLTAYRTAPTTMRPQAVV